MTCDLQETVWAVTTLPPPRIKPLGLGPRPTYHTHSVGQGRPALRFPQLSSLPVPSFFPLFSAGDRKTAQRVCVTVMTSVCRRETLDMSVFMCKQRSVLLQSQADSQAPEMSTCVTERPFIWQPAQLEAMETQSRGGALLRGALRQPLINPSTLIRPCRTDRHL